MDSNICVNQVYTDTRSDKQFRMLWVSPQKENSYIYWLNQKSGMPREVPLQQIEEGMQEGWIKECTDPYAMTREPTPDEAEHRDRLWEKLKGALQDEPGIYDKKVRAEHLRRIEQEAGEKVPNLYRHLGRYWERGKTPDAFLPAYQTSGAKGRKRLGYKRSSEGQKRAGKPIMPEDLANFEAAVRKYYLTGEEPDLKKVYKKLITDSYSFLETKPDGTEAVRTLPEGQRPSLRQFRYWYDGRKDIREEVTKRKGETEFQLKARATVGKSDFGLMGPGAQYQVDATVGDIYLVSQFDDKDIIGRPVMYFVMDIFSRIVTGMYIGLEGPSWAGMMMALYNASSDKVDYCHQFGVEITEEMWPCHHVPTVLLGDRGELESHKADGLVTMLGVRVENAPPYRGDLKPVIERHFRTVNDQVKPFLPGWVMKDQAQRGGHDYRLDAKLNLKQFTKIIIGCVLHYNNSHYLKGFEKNEQMLKSGVKAIPVKLWGWGIRNCSGMLKTYPEETIRLALMPKDHASVTEKGIYFKKLYYSCPQARDDQWFEKARKNGRYSVEVSYDPRDMSSIYVWDKSGENSYICSLVDWEQRFWGKTQEEVAYELDKQDRQAAAAEQAELESEINLDRMIESVVAEAEEASSSTKGIPKTQRIAGIRENRKEEKEAMRSYEAFTAPEEKESVAASKSVPEKSQDGQTPPKEPDWDELTPIQRMLWKDFEGRRNGDGGSEK